MSERPIHWNEGAPPDYAHDQATSRLYKHHGDYTWDDVPIQQYKPEKGGWDGIIRQILVGFREATQFHLRYFEIAPGGYSSLEQHDHAHAVIVVRGEGEAIVGDQLHTLGFLDTVYIAPNTAHQFVNSGSEPFGFICAVDAVRDRPRPIDPEQLEAILANPRTAERVRRDAPGLQRVDG